MTTTDVTDLALSSAATLQDLEELTALAIPSSSPVQVAAYLNERFPSDDGLPEKLNGFATQLKNAETRVDAVLTAVIRAHRHDTDLTKRDVSETDEALSELREKLSQLTDAATKAHTNLDAALAPAIPVFTALCNVTRASQTADSLIVLDSAVHALEGAARTADLRSLSQDVSPFVNADSALATLDSLPGGAVSRLRGLPALRARATVARESLRAAVLNAFKLQSDAVSHAGDTSTEAHEEAVQSLRAACTVAGAMGPDVRAEVIGAFVRRRRASLCAAFTADDSGLNATERRFTWIRRELRTHWARLGGERVDRGWGRVFPEEWGVARRVADGLIAECRDAVSGALDKGADRNVDAMVVALGKAKEFELELNRRFGARDESSFVGAVSDCFGPWMGAYVSHEDDQLAAILSELVRDETWRCEDGTVLKSATELFLMIKKSMRTCAALDTRQPLFSLHRVFRKHLASYAGILVRALPGVRGNALADSSKPSDFDEKLLKACAIIDTAHYCSTTTEQLEESLRKSIEEAFAPDINMSTERERFGTVSARGVQSVVALVEEDVEVELKTVSECNWAAWTGVGDASKYVVKVGKKLTDVVKKTHDRLSKQHFRFFLEKMAAAFISRFRYHLYRCERLNNYAAQQILLDVTTLRGVIVGLPASVHAATATTFVKFVNREMGKLEAVLKVILAPLKSCVDTYVALVTEGSADDLQRVLGMRGLKRAEAAPLVLEYSRRIGPSQRLKPAVQRNEIAVSRSENSVATDTAGRESGTGSLFNDIDKMATATGAVLDPSSSANAVDSMRNLFGRLGSSFIDTNISDRLGQVSSQFESTTDRLKKEAAAARWSFFGK